MVPLCVCAAPPAAAGAPVVVRAEARGQSVMFACPFGQADLPVTVVWTNSFDSEVHRGSTATGNQNYTLSAIEAHGGTYTCTASNDAGMETYMVQFLVGKIRLVTLECTHVHVCLIDRDLQPYILELLFVTSLRLKKNF